MKPSSIANTASSFFSLLPFVSAEALPALDPCWRQCFNHELPCADRDWPCFCRSARQTNLFLTTITCIRQTCTANQPFDPTALLTPFTENCKRPIDQDILSNAHALAAQDPTFPDNSTSSIIAPDNILASSPAIRAAAATTAKGRANVITTTYIGLATNADGLQETYTVPALVGLTGTIYGSPITKVDGTATPTSIITLPWPTLPVGYFFPSQSGSGAAATLPSTKATSNTFGVGVTTITSAVVAAETSGANKQETTSGGSGSGGTVLEANDGMRYGAKSSLGLMVVVLVGILWF
ncbi:MAG: hypothetical protein Q9186_002723 [Xanthomendoza sp. 1 TL-2023]